MCLTDTAIRPIAGTNTLISLYKLGEFTKSLSIIFNLLNTYQVSDVFAHVLLRAFPCMGLIVSNLIRNFELFQIFG